MVAHPLIKAWQEFKKKFTTLKNHFSKIIDDSTVKLIETAEKEYDGIMLDGQHAFHEFGLVHQKLNDSLVRFGNDSVAYNKLKNILDDLHSEVMNVKVNIFFFFTCALNNVRNN